MATQPPDDLSPFIQLAQDLREASANYDYATLGRLVAERLNPGSVTMMIYIVTSLGHLTIVGSYIEHWSPATPDVLSHEPTLEEMATTLRAAARG